MTIKFFSDRIQIGDFNLFEGNGGIQFDGVARAEQYRQKSFAQGFNYGYAAGGRDGLPGLPAPANTSIEKFSFINGTSATTVGNRVAGSIDGGGNSSQTHGYTSGGYSPVVSPTQSNTIDKFPFATDTNASSVGTLSTRRDGGVGVSSGVSGYVAGGRSDPGTRVNNIEKFSFTSDGNGSSVGALTASNDNSLASATNRTHGYIMGGSANNMINKFPFATDTNAVDTGDLTVARMYSGGGHSSSTHGYVSGGMNDPGTVFNTIDKFPFATNSNATDVGDLPRLLRHGNKQSSVTEGFSAGGTGSPESFRRDISKFPFATDTNAVDQTGTLGIYRSFSCIGPVAI